MDGQPIATVGLAVDIGYGDKKKTIFIDVTGFGKTAEMIGTLSKGDPVLIEGRIDQDAWDDKATGQKRTKLKLVVNRVHPLEWPRKADGESGVPGTVAEPMPEDDVPF